MRKLIYIIFLITGIAVNAQIAINTDGTSPDNSAILDVKSSDKGILLPRLSLTERNAIISPAIGLMIYQTGDTPGFYYNSGTPANPVWVITGTGSGWGLYGNSGTSNGTNFIGTTDDEPLAFKVNNQLSGKIDHLLYNTSLGYLSLFANTTGNNNVACGTQALTANTTGSRNNAVGYRALYLNTFGSQNTVNGYYAMHYNTTGNSNTANGYNTLLSNTTGSFNTATGFVSLYYNTTGDNNTSSGRSSLYYNTTGSSNTASGYLTLYQNTTGSYNTAIGYQALNINAAGDYNTAIGSGSGGFNDNSTYCSFLGEDADQAVYTDFINSTAIGSNSRITTSNQIRIGNGAVTSIGGYAGWSNISDGRYKKDVKENVPGLAFINQLKPVTFKLDVRGIRDFLGEDRDSEESTEGFHENTPEQKGLIEAGMKEKEQILYSGFIAQDVEKAASELGYEFSGVDKPQNENSLYGLRYAEFVVPLVKAMQELNAINEAQNTTIEELKALNAELVKRMEKLESR